MKSLIETLPKIQKVSPKAHGWVKYLSAAPSDLVNVLYESNKDKSQEELEVQIFNSWSPYYNKILGDIRIGGYTGYLCCYATCAIETEDHGNNIDGHARFMRFKELFMPLHTNIDYMNPDHPDKDGMFQQYYLGRKQEAIGRLAEKVIENIPPLTGMMIEELGLANDKEQFKPILVEYKGAILGVSVALAHILPNKKDDLLGIAISTNKKIENILPQHGKSFI